MDKVIEKFRISGKLFIWKYTENYKNYPGWNITVDNMGADKLDRLFELMINSEYPSEKQVDTYSPTDTQLNVPNNLNGKASWITKLNLIYKKFEDPNYWEIKENKNELKICFGTEKLYELKNYIREIPNGKGDYAICDAHENYILYFWWNHEK